MSKGSTFLLATSFALALTLWGARPTFAPAALEAIGDWIEARFGGR